MQRRVVGLNMTPKQQRFYKDDLVWKREVIQPVWMEPRKAAPMRDATKVWMVIGATLTAAAILLYAAVRMVGL